MDKIIFVNGKFITQRITGVQRFSYEAVKALARTAGVKTVVLIPRKAVIPRELNVPGIEFRRAGKLNGNLWEQISLPRYLKKHGKGILLNIGGIPVFYKNNYIVLHDVSFKERLPYINKKWAFQRRALLRIPVYRAKKIFTVSDFSAERIVKCYPRLKVKPVRVYPGAEHIYALKEKVVEGLPEEFYFSSSSVQPNKNFRYVLELAADNPDKFFVISGANKGVFDEFIKARNIKNCFFTGYVSDEELKWLYAHCKAFILPSLYEGFGITPLEALASGCKKLYLSDIPVFREVYGEVAEFFDPDDYAVTAALESGGEITEEQSAVFLRKFSWDNFARAVAEAVLNDKGL